MDQLHSLLRRQLKRQFGDAFDIPQQWRGFIDRVNDAYRGFDADREMLEHSLDLSSQELLDANSEMRAVFQVIPDLVFRLDHQGTILDIKAGAANDLMLKRQDLIGKRIQNVPLQAAALRFSQAIVQVNADHAPASIEYSAVLRGQESHYEARLAPLPDKQIAVIIRNITERKQSLRLLGSAVEQSAESIVITSAELDWPGAQILFINPAFTRMTGYTAAQALGQTPRILRGPKTDSAALHGMRETLRRGEAFAGETTAYRKDGTEFQMEWQVAPLRDSSGTITHFLSSQRDITARKQTELALREVNEKFHQLAENITDVFWIRSPDMRELHYISPAFEQIWGLPMEALYANPQHWTDLLWPQDRDRVLAAFDTLMSTALSISIEYRIVRPTGEVRWVHVRGFQVRDAADQLIRLTGVVTDITARKQAEQALRESEEHFRFLNNLAEATRTLADPEQIMAVTARMLGQQLHASRCAYADVEKDGERFTILHDYTDGCASTVGSYQLSLFGAQAVARLHGGETLIIRDVDTELSPDDGADMFNAIGIKAIITCPLTKEGSLRALMAVHQATPRLWTPGEIAIVQEVVERCWATIERRKAQEALRLSEERSRSIIESAQDTFISIDADGRIRDWNRQAESVFGWPRADAIGRFLHETIIPQQHHEAHLRGIRHLRGTGEGPVLNKLIELTALRRNGEEFPVEMTIWALPMGAETTYNAFVRDITERKRAQAELDNIHKQLVDASRQAGMAEIATNVLHNVGNILNSVNVSAALVSDTLRTSRARGLSRAVQLMGEHSADLGNFLTLDPKGKLLPGYLVGVVQSLAQERQRMTGELAHLTRSIDHIKSVVATQQSHAGKGNLVEPVQICDLAEDALRMNGGTLAQRQVTVVKQFAQLPVVHLDRARVLQILVNLISNAGHAMENMAGASPRLTLRVEDVAGSSLRVSVKDEGEGIPPQNLTRIFAHGFTTRKAGHGFGLHSCALAARQMGGTLTAHSDGPGRGATFTLELPIDTGPATP
ncbi:MAG TPA: PAS domain S-box protein [Ramlibacter sp.]|nr:PAS domain S-box protein [Ramlibacter sp.]